MTPFEDAYDKTLEDAIKTRPSKEGWFGHAVVQKMKVPKSWFQQIAKIYSDSMVAAVSRGIAGMGANQATDNRISI